jgi:hypothetical protein
MSEEGKFKLHCLINPSRPRNRWRRAQITMMSDSNGSGAINENMNSPLLATPAARFSFTSPSRNINTAAMNIQSPSQRRTGELSPTIVEEAAETPTEPNHSAPTGLGGVAKSHTDLSWGVPAGLHIRRFNDENLVIFRRAVGINSTLSGSTDPDSLEAGRRKAMGIYAAALKAERNKKLMYHLTSVLINACHFSQIIIGASLTAL